MLDEWYYTPDGLAMGLPSLYNKQLFVTERQTGVKIRPSE